MFLGSAPTNSPIASFEATMKPSTRLVQQGYQRTKESIVEDIIFNTIVSITSLIEEVPVESFLQFQKYLLNPNTTDLVYLQIMKRSKEYFFDQLVVHKCVHLIISNFKTNVPSVSCAVQIDQHCWSIKKDQVIKDKMTLKLVSLLENMVLEHVQGLNTEDQQKFKTLKLKIEKERKSHKRSDGRSQSLGPTDPKKKNQIEENFVENRIKFQVIHKTSLDCIVFGGQFRKITKFEDKLPELDLSSTINKYLTNDISKVKEIEKTRKMTDSIKLTMLDQSPKIFLNNENLPQELNEKSFDDLLNLILKPIDPESTVIAQNIIIHVFGDFLLKGNKIAFFHTRRFFFELLELKEKSAIIRSFEMLYNLYIFLKKKENQLCLEQIFKRFSEMTLFIYLNIINDKEIWDLIFIHLHAYSLNANFNKLILYYFDERVLLKLLNQTNELECQKFLITLLINNLYHEGVYDQEKIQKIGGVSVIIDQFLATRSLITKQNLFIIIFDYLTNELKKQKKIKPNQESELLNLLFSSDAQLYIDQIFKFLPEKFIEKFSKFLSIELVLKEKIADSLDQQTIVNFVFELYNLSSKYLMMENEINSRCIEFLHETNTNEHFSVLKYLIYSNDPLERKNGESMLFICLTDEKLNQIGELLMSELCKKSKGRSIYLNLVEKIVLYKKSKFQVFHDEKKLNDLFKYLNDSLLQFFHIKETNPNLLLQAFYLIVDLVSIYDKDLQKVLNEKEDWCALFREGFIQIPSNLIKEIHVTIFHQLYLNIFDPNIKVICFIFILEKCKKKSNLDLIGGNSFFITALDHQNASIC
eukprot:gene8237-62_t